MPFSGTDGEAAYLALKELRPHSSGLLRTITAVDSYVGTTRANAADAYPVLDGIGTVHARLGYDFTGAMKDGEPCGQGMLRWADGRTVLGVFSHGTVDGVGTLRWPNGDCYTGSLQRSVRHGRGTFTTDGGASRYEGEWQGGMRNGEGVQHYANGGVYSGQWRLNARHGHGTLRYSSGDVYEGEWEADIPSGHGTMGWVDAAKKSYVELYVGEWRSGRPEGQGQSTYVSLPTQSTTADGTASLPPPSLFLAPAEACLNVYVGEFREGLRDGVGTFYYADGSCYQGMWKAGEKCGPGYFTSAVGEVREEQQGSRDGSTPEQIAALAIVPVVSPRGLGSLLESEADLVTILHNLLHRYNTTLKSLFQCCCRLQENVALPSTRRDWWQQRLPGRATVVQCLSLLHAGRVLGAAFTIGDALRTAAAVLRAEAATLEQQQQQQSTLLPAAAASTPLPATLTPQAGDILRVDGALNYRQFCEWLIRVAAQVKCGPGTITISAKLSALLDNTLGPLLAAPSATALLNPAVAAVFLPRSMQRAADVQAQLPTLTRLYAQLQSAEGGEDSCVSLRTTLAALQFALRQHELTPSALIVALAWLKDSAGAGDASADAAAPSTLAQELRAAAVAKSRSVQQPVEDAEAAQSFVEFVETVMTAADLVQQRDGTALPSLLREMQCSLFAE